MMKDKIIEVFIDIGSLKLKAIVGELSTKENKLKILKYLETYSNGINKGKIEDTELLTIALRELLDKLNDGLEKPIDKVNVGISSIELNSQSENIEINLEKETKIEERHLEELIQRAKERILRETEIILDSQIYNIKLEDDSVIKNPIGRISSVLRGRVHLIFGTQEFVEKLKHCVAEAGVELGRIILNMEATAKSILTEEDIDRGTALIDIGDGTTDIGIYRQDKLIFNYSLPIGGRNFLNDLTYIEDIKNSENELVYAYEILTKYRRNNNIAGNIFYGQNKKIKYDIVKQIIDDRMNDIVLNIKNVIEKSGFENIISKGIILTGGVLDDPIINVDELIESIQSKIKIFTKIVIPQNYFSGLKEINSGMTSVLGLMYIIMEEEVRKEENIYYEEIEVEEESDKNFEFQSDIEKFSDEAIEEDVEINEKAGIFGTFKKWMSHII